MYRSARSYNLSAEGQFNFSSFHLTSTLHRNTIPEITITGELPFRHRLNIVEEVYKWAMYKILPSTTHHSITISLKSQRKCTIEKYPCQTSLISHYTSQRSCY